MTAKPIASGYRIMRNQNKKVMSTIKKNPMVQSASGMVGDTVVFRTVRGKLQMANVPGKRTGKASQKQAAVQRKFQEAAQYAKRQISQPEFNTLYTSGITGKKHSAYLVAMNDYLIAPTVDSIDALSYRGAKGDVIVIKAIDDFMVTKVKIVVTNAAGVVIEEGEAGPDLTRTNQWGYKATAANPTLAGTKIRAVAYDRPGNTGTAEIVL
jgi:hypothetical protein